MAKLQHALLLTILALPAAGQSNPDQPNPAQSSQSALETRLVGKPLYLRGLYRADNLHFDGTGRLVAPSETTSFTLSGVDITRVQLQAASLILDGRRMGLELEQKDARTRVPLQTGGGAEEPIHIEIDMPPGADSTRTLSAIFADLPELVPALPAYWQTYATHNFLAPGSEQPLHSEKEEKALVKPIEKGGKDSIIKPTLLRSASPQLTDAAQNLHYKATVIVSLVVERDGVPSHLQVLRPAGLGLDEQAIAAVAKYIFNPATQKGRPIPVDLNVEVNFNGGGAQ